MSKCKFPDCATGGPGIDIPGDAAWGDYCEYHRNYNSHESQEAYEATIKTLIHAFDKQKAKIEKLREQLAYAEAALIDCTQNTNVHPHLWSKIAQAYFAKYKGEKA